MVCPKLRTGSCMALKSYCPQKYEIKMVKYRDCSVFKGKKKAVKRTKRVSRRKKSLKRRKK